MCMISDHMAHDTHAVYSFQKILTTYIKQNLPNVNHIEYFSEGSAAQYKNYKNFVNLCHHENDFNLTAERNFFATSHGKGPCDGIGGVIKRLATRYSKQLVQSGKDRLLTAKQLYEYANENIKGVEVYWVRTEDIEEVKKYLCTRFENANKIPGCRGQHYFLPDTNHSISVHRISPISNTETMSDG